MVCILGQENLKVNEPRIAILRMERHITAIYIWWVTHLMNVVKTWCLHKPFTLSRFYNSSYKICPWTKANTWVFGISYKFSEPDCKINYWQENLTAWSL